MKREDFDAEDEYVEFRRKANLRNKKYYSKPEVKVRKAVYKKEYERRDYVKERMKRKRATPEDKARMKKWTEENRDKIQANRDRPENKRKKRRADKEYYKKYYKRPEVQIKVKAYRKKYRAENLEKIKAEHRAYYKTPRGKAVSDKFVHKRLTLLRDNEFDLTVDEICKIKARDKKCVYCNGDGKLELDHIIPLSKGGASCYNNYVRACQKCNRSKSAKDVFKWCKNQGVEVPVIVRELLILQNN
ncbi:MAG: HNH endonuclease [Candidatus Heimdallarchaeota archaeon]|nr:HNH endonuclease [Candidatus Heimdallarchaeota archaeon]MCK5048933.1 HNH endonuclease [Candidatus Heimdallarchaeota archaeon]